MRIDFHAHVVPAGYLELARRGEAPDVRLEGNVLVVSGDGETGPVAQRITLSPVYWKPEARRKAMADVGVDIHVLSPVQFLYHYWCDGEAAARLSRLVNDGIAEMVRSDRAHFAGMATVPLQDVARAIAELERVHAALGMRAVEIGTHVAGRPLDIDALDPFWARAEALGTVVFVHPYAPLGPGRLTGYFLRNLLGNPFETAVAMSQLIFGGVLDRFPRLRFCVAHGGGAMPAVLGRLDRGFEVSPACRVRTVSPPSSYLRRFFYDTITHDVAALAALVARVGAAQVVMGSDFPFDIGDLDPVATVAKLALGQSERDAILGGNAARLLGLGGSSR